MQMIFENKYKNMICDPNKQEKKNEQVIDLTMINLLNTLSIQKYDMFYKASYSKKCSGCGR